MAHDIKNQVGIGEPERDWFPISFMSTFSDWADLIHGPGAEWGQLSCGCHPNCGIGMALMIDKETKEAAPVTAFLNMNKVAKDLAKVNDAARGKWMSVIGFGLALLRNYDPFQAPTHFKITDMLKKMGQDLQRNRPRLRQRQGRPHDGRYQEAALGSLELPVHRRDVVPGSVQLRLRRTEQCIIPYATQEGEISFCAYNTGIGWRNIIEKMHMTATLTKWYEEHGRHEIFAGGKKVGMSNVGHELVLNMEHVNSRGQPHAGRAGHREELPRREAARPCHDQCGEAEDRCRERPDGQALPRARTRRKAGRRPGSPDSIAPAKPVKQETVEPVAGD